MIHGKTGTSAYFQGAFAEYGRNQWNVKLPGHSDDDCELLASYFLEDQAFIDSELGQDMRGESIRLRLEGRSGGWLVSDNTLSQAQIDYITRQIEYLKAGKFDFLLGE